MKRQLQCGEGLSNDAMIDAVEIGTVSKNSGITCDCCGNSKAVFIATKRGHKLYQCDNCSLIFVWPQPELEQLAQLYRKSAGYFATAKIDLSKTSPHYALEMKNILLKNGLEKGRFLDIGCSTGALLYHMQRLGWEVTGTEINPDAAEIAQQNNLDIFAGELENYQANGKLFDVIHLGDVIEHLRSPRQILLTVHRLLRPGGLIVVKTANAKCGFSVSSLLLAKISGFPWPQSEAPYHLYDFYPETLAQLVTSTGFEVISSHCSEHPSFLYTIGASGLFDELKVSMKKTGRYRPNFQLLVNIPKLAIVAGIIMPFYIYGRISDKLFCTGSEVTIVGRRL